MSTLTLFVKSSIGRKWIVALTGLALAGFVLGHMAGNLLMFVSPEAYNAYGHGITANPLYKSGLIPYGLVATFLIHVFFILLLARENMAARQTRYAVAAREKTARFASRWMMATGSIVLVFVILHLITFKYGPVYDTEIHGEKVRDLFKLMVEVFKNPVYVGWYLVCLVLLGFHLSHGFSSAVKTLGLSNPKYIRTVEIFGYVYSVVVALGFIAQPLYVWLVYKG